MTLRIKQATPMGGELRRTYSIEHVLNNPGVYRIENESNGDDVFIVGGRSKNRSSIYSDGVMIEAIEPEAWEGTDFVLSDPVTLTFSNE